MSFRRLLILFFALLTTAPLFAAKGEAYPGLGRKWQYYRSPNFELYSANNDRESRDVLERLELLRALFLETFKLKARMPQPVTIYYFSKQDEFDGYRPLHVRGGSARYAGFCNSFPDRTVIMLAPASDRERAAEVIYHEYIHYLFRITEQNPAPWFNEGVAELFSTMEEDGEWLQLGRPIPGRILELQRGPMMSFDQLFAVEYESPLFKNSGHTGMFYSQSWAFMHFCYFGVNKIPPDKMTLFLRVAGSSQVQEKPEAFRAVARELLGLEYPEITKEMKRYITTGKFVGRKAKKPTIAPRQEYTVRPAPADEMQLMLAELSVRMTDSPYANLLLRQQLERAENLRLRELLGAVAMRADENDEAREQWRQAIELGTENVAVFRELARLESNAVFREFNLDYEMPEKRTADLRRLLGKSLETAPDQSQGYEMLAWVEATSAKPDLAALRTIQNRFTTLNDRGRTLLALVIVRMRLGQKADALALLGQLDQTDPSDWVRYCAELTRARLENRAVDPERLPKHAGPGIRVGTPTFQLPK